MRKIEFYYDSSDGQTKIHAYKWIPDTNAKAVLLVCHGMVEMIDRYDEFAQWMADKSVAVYGNDHLGHGKSVTCKKKYGYFADENGNRCVIDDINKLKETAVSEFPDTPVFILGHSMGSFLARQYIIEHSNGLDGAIIMGTASMPPFVTKMGMFMCRISATAHKQGWYYRSSFINNMGMGGYNKKFGDKEGKDWLSLNPENVKRNLAEPLCNFMFTVNGYYNMFKGLNFVSKRKNVEKIPKDLPILLVAGQDDPVGNFGKGVTDVYKQYHECGIKDVGIKLYPMLRHEILQEESKIDVYEDIFRFIVRILGI